MTLDQDMIDKAAELCRQRGIVIPTIAQMQDPAKIPDPIRARLADVGLWDLHLTNLLATEWDRQIDELNQRAGILQ